jgi:hypothetical protein
MEDRVALFIPIVLFVCITFAITYSIRLVLDARIRRQLIAAGSQEMMASLMKGDEQNRRLSSLRWGVILVALGIGFAIIQGAGWQDISPGMIAVLAGATGIGNLVYYFVARKQG